MKYNELVSTKFKDKRRRGRGISGGLGKTAGRGTKGQRSRSGHKLGPRFEGGQNPLHMRMPKMSGFKSHRRLIQVVKTSELDKNFTASNAINGASLFEKGLIDDAFKAVKLIFDEEVSKAFKVEAQGVSKNALQTIEKSGGSVKIVSIGQRLKAAAPKK